MLTPLLQRDLNDFAWRWNSHWLRHERNHRSQRGACPNDFYLIPELYGNLLCNRPLFVTYSPLCLLGSTDCKKPTVERVLTYGGTLLGGATDAVGVPQPLRSLADRFLRRRQLTLDDIFTLDINTAIEVAFDFASYVV